MSLFGLLIQCLQDYFWTFCMKSWKTKTIDESNLEAEAHLAAKEYLQSIQESFVVTPERSCVLKIRSGSAKGIYIHPWMHVPTHAKMFGLENVNSIS